MSEGRLTVLVIAAAMIGVGGLVTAWNRSGAITEGATSESRSLDLLWRVLPLVFLAFLIGFAAVQGA